MKGVDGPMIKEEKINGIPKWEVESALDTLISARKILRDKKKVAAIRQIAADRVRAVQEAAMQLNLENKVAQKLEKMS